VPSTARRRRDTFVVASLLAGGLTVAAATLQGVDLRLDTTAIGDAVSLGQTSMAGVLPRFHQAYRVPVSKPPFDYLEIVTPFRRIALAAEALARAGDRSFAQRQALQIDREAPGQIDVYAELTFHPLNTFVLVPSYHITLVLPSGEIVQPRNVSRMARYGARVEGSGVPHTPTPIPGGAVPGRTQPLLGATVMATFDGFVLAGRCDRTCDVMINEEGGRSAALVGIALGNIR
jgi:hypothetical protein